MSLFYTSVSRAGPNILCRGYSDGVKFQKKIQFSPTLFVTSDKVVGPWKSLYGKSVEPMKFNTMPEAAEFVAQYSNVESFEIHGMTNYVTQFIAEAFGNDEIPFNRSQVNVTSIDIEVASDAGFPEPSVALHPVISIAVFNNHLGSYVAWGMGDYDKNKSEVADPDDIEYRQFDSEASLLMNFILWWADPTNMPDVITGWNSKLFDMVYLVNRITSVCGDHFAKKLSPFSKIYRRDIKMQYKSVMNYEIVGIQQLDYLDLFKKFGYSYGAQESYKLDHIAHVVLGENKLSYEEYGSLTGLYKQNHQRFLDYNLKDVALIQRMDDMLGFVELAMVVAFKAGVNYSDAFGTTSVWDAFIYRVLNGQHIAVPITTPGLKTTISGGHVKPPVVGRHDWVVSFDLNSLYPHIFMQYNMSPDTIVNDCQDGVTPESVLGGVVNDNPKYSMAATGQYFRKDKRGVIPSIIDKLYTERKGIKGEMLNWKQKKEKLDPNSNTEEIYKVDQQIATLDNKQQAIKILMNSLYGAMGNVYFRYFDIRIADAITSSGRLSILWAEKAINKYLNVMQKTNDVDYIIAIDTDSLYIAVNDIVLSVGIENIPDNAQKIVKFLDKLCSEALEPEIGRAYQVLSDRMGAYENKMVMSREAIAERGIWTAKKRYILSVWNNEGVQYTVPDLKIMGIEAIKSSTPEVCRDKFKELFKLLISGTEEEVQSFVADFKQEFKNLPLESISAPRGVSNITKYQQRIPNKQGVFCYIKGTPMNARGAIVYNNAIVEGDLINNYPRVQDGEKIKMLALKVPNPAGDNIISYPEAFPKEIGLGEDGMGISLAEYVDYETQFDKTFENSLTIILDAIGWTAEPRSTLEDFFG